MPPDDPREGLNARLAALPSVDTLLERPSTRALLAVHGRALLLEVVRAQIARARDRLRDPSTSKENDPLLIDAETGDEALQSALDRLTAPALPPVQNATGVILHTNLGRAPLAPAARAAMVAAAAYVPLEIDLISGRRGARAPSVIEDLKALSGAEAGLVVNNGAAAVLLALTVLARGREVIVSRGQLVEIGGGFRVPEVMAQSGCTLCEVGTTNRTRLRDHAAAIGPKTAALLEVHRSNFSLEGFTEDTPLEALVSLGRETELPVIVDLGSGLFSVAAEGTVLEGQVTVDGCIAAGAEVVCFSGDKLLGGPQAGIIVGRKATIEALARHPLMRSLRCDKVTLAALGATLLLLRREALKEVPLQRMLRATLPDLSALGETMVRPLRELGLDASLERSTDRVGGGSAHRLSLPGMAVCLKVPSPEIVARHLRLGTREALRVVGVVREGALWLHLRTLDPDQIDAVAQAVILAASAR